MDLDERRKKFLQDHPEFMVRSERREARENAEILHNQRWGNFAWRMLNLAEIKWREGRPKHRIHRADA